VFALAALYLGLQLSTHGHTGIRRAWSDALNTVRSLSTSQKAEEGLKGLAVVDPLHSVTLTWNASPSSGVRYNVYRRDAVGEVIRVNAKPITDTNYTDHSVQPGQVYFYSARAISLSGIQSQPSNEVRVDVPLP
jgi:fibronectin type 3 domain-containing protein